MYLSPDQIRTATALLMERNPGMAEEDARSIALQRNGQGVADEKGRSRVILHGRTAWLRRDLILETQ